MSASSTDILPMAEAQTQDPRWSDITRRSCSAATEALGASMEARRRKVRKGTRSCWECKRQKHKCEFESPSDPACLRCRRRGTKCLGQQYPDQPSRRLNDRIIRVETLIEQLVNRANDGSPSDLNSAPLSKLSGLDTSQPATPVTATTITASSLAMATRFGSFDGSMVRKEDDKIWQGIATPESMECEQSPSKHREPASSLMKNPRPLNLLPPTLVFSQAPQYLELSRTLYAALPTPQDIELVIQSPCHHLVQMEQLLTKSYLTLEKEGLRKASELLAMPSADAHPVLLARYMLLYCSYIQYLPHDYNKYMPSLSEPPRAMIKRLSDTAINLVTSNDEFMGSLEALECLMLEGLLLQNMGHLRRAWMIFRRAMVVAQLMGLHGTFRSPIKSIDPNSQHEPDFMWFRIVLSDRHLSLMLDLPQGSLEQSSASEAQLASDTALGSLERLHCKLASRILERNERGLSDPESFELTSEIDLELQRAASIMSAKWWLPSNTAKIAETTAGDPLGGLHESLRLFNHVFHFNLLNKLHLPYLLSPPTQDRRYDYSQMMCVNASREILIRAVNFRSVNRIPFCCRIIDFFALMGAMTLLLAHLNSHIPQPSSLGQNLLAHQRVTDRAMIEQMLENMDTIAEASMDVLSEKSADLIRRLLAIEEDAAAGQGAYRAQKSQESPLAVGLGDRVYDNEAEAIGLSSGEDDSSLRISIPYFGIIKIAREGTISKELPVLVLPGQGRTPPSATWDNQLRQQERQHSVVSSTRDSLINVATTPTAQSVLLPQQQPQQQGGSVTELHTAVNDALIQQQYLFPALTVGAEDWAFQGVDIAFFDNVMKGAEFYAMDCEGEVAYTDGGSVQTEWVV